jgi:cAMP-specific phosphodiesterase 4/calcium/calmodulin-dependent 3',5'-cyclic nucleotide phosphodiesterase
MDRCTTNIAESQRGFIDFIIKPSFGLMVQFLPKAEGIMERIELNKLEWEKRSPEYQRQMEEEKLKYETRRRSSKNSVKNEQLVQLI